MFLSERIWLLPTPVCDSGLDASQLICAIDEATDFRDFERSWKRFCHVDVVYKVPR